MPRVDLKRGEIFISTAPLMGFSVAEFRENLPWFGFGISTSLSILNPLEEV
jgi:hypothetical protein